MKLNGNLVLNAGGTSQIENLVVEKLAGLPTFSASEKGRLVYNTVSNVLYFNNGTEYVAFATGGNAAALQTEVDAIETSLGALVNADGTFNAGGVTFTNVTTPSSIANILAQLDAAIQGQNTLAELDDVTIGGAQVAGEVLQWNGSAWVNSDVTIAEVTGLQAALDAEITARTAGDATGTAAVAAEATARAAADTTLTNALAAEVTARTDADATLTANLAIEQTARIAGDAAANAAVATETTLRTAADAALQTALDAETTARQTADTTEAGTRASADTALTNALASEETLRIAGDATNAANLLAETTARQAADLGHDTAISERVKLIGDTMGGNLSFNGLYKVTGLAAPTAAADAANKQYVDDVAAGLTWKNSAVAASTGNIALDGSVTVVDGVTLATGNRVLVLAQTAPAENGIYVVPASGAWTRDSGADTTAELANAALFVQGGTTYADTAWVQTATVAVVGTSPVTFSQFSGGAVVTPGVGLSQSGSTFNVNLGAGIAELPSDEIAVDLFTAGGLFLTVDGLVADASASAQVAVQLDGSTISRTGNGIKVADATILRITTVEGGLASEITNRQSAVTGVQANLDTETTARTAADQALTDALAVEQTARLAGDATAAGAVLAEQTARVAADAVLQAAIDAEVTARQGADSTLTTNLGNEVTRATAAEGVLTGALATETTARTAADTVLTDALAVEVTARTAADTAINTKIAKGYYSAAQSSGTTWVVTHNIGSKFCNVTVVDSTDEVIIPQSIKFDSATQLTVTFNAAVAGTIVVMGLGV